MSNVTDGSWLSYAMDRCVLKDTEVMSGLNAKQFYSGSEKGEVWLIHFVFIYLLCSNTRGQEMFLKSVSPPSQSLGHLSPQ